MASGNILITLGGKQHELVPTPGALRSISMMYNGLGPADARVRDYDATAIAFVIGVGIGKTKSAEITEIEEMIFTDGLMSFWRPASDFCSRLANGGRDPALDDDKKK
jgi:hypothetical protein